MNEETKEKKPPRILGEWGYEDGPKYRAVLCGEGTATEAFVIEWRSEDAMLNPTWVPPRRDDGWADALHVLLRSIQKEEFAIVKLERPESAE